MKFNGQRLTADRVEEYLLDAYPQFSYIENCETFLIKNINSLKQSDFGDELDCTLTSLTTCIDYILKGEMNLKEIYLLIERVSIKYFYNGKKWGTIPIFIRKIYDKVLKSLNIDKKSKRRYFKNIGYNFQLIKKLIKNNIPIILSIYKDGRNCYDNHSVSIIGYSIFTLSNEKENKKIYMLNVYDNWGSAITFIDYNLLNTISMINFFDF